MSLLSTSVSNFVNGVSQQADFLRYPSQCDEQSNALSSVIDGLVKRPPLNHVKKLYNSGVLGSAFFHKINRDTNERYQLVVRSGAMEIFDVAGNSYPVKDKDGNIADAADFTYLTTATPGKSLRAITIADYTFLLNREKTVAMRSDLSAVPTPACLLFIKQFKAGMKFTVNLYNDTTSNTPTWTYSLYGAGVAASNGLVNFDGVGTGVVGTPIIDPDTGEITGYTSSYDYGCVDQGDIARAFVSLLGLGGATADYALTTEEGAVYIKRTNNSDFRAELVCSVPEGVFVFKDEVQNFSLLPKRGYVGFQIKISGDPESDGDEYYVKYVPSNSHATGFATGFWEESLKPGTAYKLDETTLPHVLVSFGTYFVFKPATWDNRLVGDSTSNPDPSLVGQKIRNLFFWNNRLGLLAGENVVQSANSDFFRFFRKTVITILESDPIDVGMSHTKVAILNAAIPTSEQLLLTSDQTQFTFKNNEATKAESRPTTEIENLKDIDPIPLGNSVFFPFNRGDFSGLTEYAIDSETGLFAGTDVTSHVPRYISGTITKMVGSETDGIIFVMTDGFTQGLFVYRYYLKNRQRILSSWFKFDFGDGIVVRDVMMINTTVYFIVTRADGTFLESMDISPGLKDPGEDYCILLDRKINETALVARSYDEVTNQTSLTLPYTPTASIFILNRDGNFKLDVRSVVGTVVKVRGDYSAAELWIGEPYTKRYVMTKPTLRTQTDSGSFVVTPGRFQVRRGLLSYDNSLYFKVVVTPLYRDTYTYVYENRNVNVGNLVVDQPTNKKDGTFPFPVMSKNDQVTIEIINDSPYPSSILGVDWEALYTVRARRI